MPLYEYQCPGGDGHTFQALTPMDQRDNAVCPDHPDALVARLLSQVAPLASSATITRSDMARELYGHSEVPTIGEVIDKTAKLAARLDGVKKKLVGEITGF